MKNVPTVFVSLPKFLLNIFSHFLSQIDLSCTFPLHKVSPNTGMNIKLVRAL